MLSKEQRLRRKINLGGVEVKFVDDHTIEYVSIDAKDARSNYEKVINELKDKGYKEKDRECKKLFEEENDLKCKKTLTIEDAWEREEE